MGTGVWVVAGGGGGEVGDSVVGGRGAGLEAVVGVCGHFCCCCCSRVFVWRGHLGGDGSGVGDGGRAGMELFGDG